jgi:2-polyprenyl-3-methyl-5-hydroxy-6-metoxy-1,4-benzoquinol methylase
MAVAPNETIETYSALVDRVGPLSGQRSTLVIDAARSPFTPLPFQSNSMPALVVTGLEAVPEDVLGVAIGELARVASRYLFVSVSSGTRAWWESTFFAAGFGKHPLYQQLVPYAALEHEGPDVLMAFERLPQAGLTRFTSEVLRIERDLHMDMLRESGRRADAHVVRYTLASQLVHKGDRVIDAACGLGYGSALVYDCGLADSILAVDSSAFVVEYGHAIFAERRPGLTFIESDVHCIASLPERSADVVISFETLEHIVDPHAFVAQAAQVLAPGGRFICSVPNQWVDESGRDPNPYHLHVFDLPKLLGLFSEDFRIDRVIGQIAGGGMQHNGAARTIVDVNPIAPSVDPEWWLVVATRAHRAA